MASIKNITKTKRSDQQNLSHNLTRHEDVFNDYHESQNHNMFNYNNPTPTVENFNAANTTSNDIWNGFFNDSKMSKNSNENDDPFGPIPDNKKKLVSASFYDNKKKLVSASFYNNKKHSDFTIATRNNERDCEWYCHKVILAMNSEYFANILDSDFKESKDGMISLPESEVEISNMLKYIYEGIFHSTDYELIKSMYVVADKYQIIGLKDITITLLINHVNTDTIFELLAFSTENKLTEIKHACQAFLISAKFDINKLGESLLTTLYIKK